MEFTSALFLIVFVVLGGVIAVVADELGRRIGKRRLVLHRRIRPRTTARIITFLAGMTITILTIVLIWVASSDVRVWLREGGKAVKQRDQLQDQVNGLKEQKSSYQNANAVLRTDIRNNEVAERQLKEQATKLKQSVTGFQTKLGDAQAKIAGLNDRMAFLNRSIAVAEKAKQEAVSLGKAALLSYQQLKVSYREVSKQQAELSQHDLDLDHKLRDSEKQLKSTLAEIDARSKELADDTASIASLRADVASLTQQRASAKSDLDAAENQLADARTQAAEIHNALDQSAAQVRFSPLIFSLGDELDRVSVPAGSSKSDVAEKIESALLLARDVAKEHGAKQANRIDYAGMIESPDKQGHPLSVEAQKDLLASQLAGSRVDEEIIVYSWSNAFAGEGVIVRLANLPNPVVFEANQILSQIRISSRGDASTILGELNGLGVMIRDLALKKKMIPIQKGDRSLGVVSSEDIINLFDKIKAASGSVKVIARARRLTRAADPLLIDFEVQ